MSSSHRRIERLARGESGVRPDRKRRRRPGWGNAAILRTAALVIGMYLLVRLLWFAHFLVLVAFLGVLFGLAVSAGVDRLQRWRIPRGLGAALIVLSFFGVLVGFGAWMAPTLRAQSAEIRRRMPDAIDRIEAWMNTHRSGFLGLIVNSIAGGRSAQTCGEMAQSHTNRAPAGTVARNSRPAGGWHSNASRVRCRRLTAPIQRIASESSAAADQRRTGADSRNGKDRRTTCVIARRMLAGALPAARPRATVPVVQSGWHSTCHARRAPSRVRSASRLADDPVIRSSSR